MKILVTGGAGFIGSHVVDRYVGLGHPVVVVDDLSTGREANLNPAAAFYRLDIRNPCLMEVFEKEQPEVVNHHAAQIDVRRSVAQPVFDADINILGALNLLECARQTRVQRVIYSSSGGAAYGEPRSLPCDETHPVDPLSPYGVSKHTVEHYLYLYHVNHGLKSTILRYANVYGPRQDPTGEAGVVAIFISRMLAGQPVTINGDGEQQRDFVYVEDCAHANVLALADPDPIGLYNIGCGQATSINELFALVQALTSYGRLPIHGPAKPGETRRIYLNADKARHALGWTPALNLPAGLQHTLAYFAGLESASAAPSAVPL
jgi:UDP-glucose 4-epimerase